MDFPASLSSKQLLAISHLTMGDTIDATAAKVGVHERTIDKWLTLSDFNDALKASKKRLWEDLHRAEVEKIRDDLNVNGNRIHTLSSSLLTHYETWLTDFDMKSLSDTNKIKLLSELRYLMDQASTYRQQAMGIDALLQDLEGRQNEI
ncbi:helix-turn-helix domain-containing protein [Nodosilinea sp. AN01ver1]|uniref:helix-turn-helix domain-containing protein n=1 Tax=Nodosilinea sp. AN01ver1 TaxID=3423362 RepID=UPI003D320BB7